MPDDGTEKRQFNIYLPADLIKRVKRAALDSDSSLSGFVEHALEHRLDELEDQGDGE